MKDRYLSSCRVAISLRFPALTYVIPTEVEESPDVFRELSTTRKVMQRDIEET